jgi:DNA-binding helix-hairpin-helix protein with protein kinase domain
MKVTLSDNRIIDCQEQPFASGADGDAYWTKDKKYLVKLYHHPESWREKTLEAIIDRFNAVKDEPYWESLLCWPLGIVRSPRLGVIVPKAADNLQKVGRLILPKWLNKHPEDIGSWNARVMITYRLARAVKRLHFMGLCHSDLSDNNILANSVDGRMYLIDMDGLVVPGIAQAVVEGTRTYMAPELVSKKVQSPNVETDQHALSVLIYQILLLRHPLEGMKIHDSLDPELDDQLRYGENALFIEHPRDKSNRPQKLVWSYAQISPGFIRLIEKSFIQGLHKPVYRPLAADWERELLNILDILVICLNKTCFFKSFPLPEGQRKIKCPWCGTPFQGVCLPVLYWYSPTPSQSGHYQADQTRKVGWPEETLHEWHIVPKKIPDTKSDPQPLAKFVSQVHSGQIHWYLINLKLPYFEAADPGDNWKRIPINQALELKKGRKLRFGLPGQARDAIVDLLQS